MLSKGTASTLSARVWLQIGGQAVSATVVCFLVTVFESLYLVMQVSNCIPQKTTMVFQRTLVTNIIALLGSCTSLDHARSCPPSNVHAHTHARPPGARRSRRHRPPCTGGTACVCGRPPSHLYVTGALVWSEIEWIGKRCRVAHARQDLQGVGASRRQGQARGPVDGALLCLVFETLISLDTVVRLQ
jgi:hypothetical protein